MNKTQQTQDSPALTELQALQNAVNYADITGLNVHEYLFQDKRKSLKKYFLQIGHETISPVLDYENLNHFLLGLIKGKKLFN